LKETLITEKTVLRFRSFVHEPMQYGRLLLAGDAAHTVPPTGAKGLNLALADVRVLADALERAVCTDSDEPLRGYTKVALARAWKRPALLGSQAASTFLAEGYTGWPT
jgi:2-polyprenyl-6-methoxyphenol hydroxylase-like FAD-dependent oxidoreductase